MFPTIIKTADGSHSLYLKELNEHYHSIHGAVQESKHVFINVGLKHIFKTSNLISEINILEIGLGTGLNAFLSFIEAEQHSLNINYTAIEAFPVSIDLIDQLNYVECLEAKKYQSVFNKIHTCEWEKVIELSNHFSFCKIKNKLQNIVFENKYNLIYFDVFGPQVQPKMWTEEVFTKLFSALEPNGCLVTYCAKGEVKRTLKRVGFTVESLAGPPGKREMIRALKNNFIIF
jgi:tRNA U34 5-methylaminomethyl-2-thiouridine-forming methyltransferase MnmC